MRFTPHLVLAVRLPRKLKTTDTAPLNNGPRGAPAGTVARNP
jgi:hypothetical protein